MKRSTANKIKGIIGIVLIVAVGFGVFYWEAYGREALIYEEVIVLTKDVQKNTEITEDIIQYVKRDQSAVIEGSLKDPYKVIGKEAKHFIPKNTQIVSNYFDAPNLVLSEEEFIFRIPNDWLKAFPPSIRRKDVAYFYPVDQSRKAPEDFDFSKKDEDAITSAIIAYVKDSANREVTSTSLEDRLDASSNISSVEIIGTLEKIEKLKKYYEDGYQFIIMYQ